ncbi:MAG TPA: sulfite oxidase, partial [Ardenticatenaceae bacterium]|nr:sulfite oxidase [Ardenticatenaceae bacterium]
MEQNTDYLRKPTPEEHFILHGEAAETRLESLSQDGLITPTERFFVRNHSATPCIDIETWRLTIEGPGVTRRLQLDYADLLARPARTVTRFLECAGNGRAYFDLVLGKPAEGSQWLCGGYGVAEWTGVPLADLLEEAGLKPTAVDVMACGLDAVRMGRPVPVAKALMEDTLLVHTMNGAPLEPDHGFPARLLVPSWIGGASIKWVGAIEVSEQPRFVHWNTRDYILEGPDHPPQPPAEGEILTTTLVKSTVALPWPARLRAGRQEITGYAWSPFGRIARVDVSLDEGATFQPVERVAPNLAAAGSRWRCHLSLPPGEHTITVCATDEHGNSQYD